jgi:hypothetical protein
LNQHTQILSLMLFPMSHEVTVVLTTGEVRAQEQGGG